MHIRTLCRVLATSLALATAIASAADPPFTLKQVLSAPFPEELTASPDGTRLAWLANERGRRNVWTAHAPDFKARQLTAFDKDDGIALSELTWSPDSSSLLFVRGQGKNAEGEVPNPTSNPAGTEQGLYAASFAGGSPRKLGNGSRICISVTREVAYVSGGQIWAAPLRATSPARQLFKARGKNGSPKWSPDGRILAFVSDRQDHSFVGLYRPADESIRYIAPSIDLDHSPCWSRDGKKIAFIRQPGRGSEQPPGSDEIPAPWAIWLADTSTLQARQIWTSGPDPAAALPRIAAEDPLRWGVGGILTFPWERDGWMHMYSLSGAGNDPLLLTPGECEVEDAVLSPDGQSLVYVSNCGDIDRRHLWKVSVNGGLPEQLTAGDKVEWNPALLGGGSIAFLRSDARIPAAPCLMSGKGGATRAIAPYLLPKEFPAASLVVPESVLFRSPDGLEIHGQLFLPSSSRAGKLPAVIYMHGGPMRQMLPAWHYRYYYHNAYGMNQYLASRGYAVLSVNFRSGIGYGREFREAAGCGRRGASEYQDILAAARYLRLRPDVDGSRIGLWGGSYGGYLTALCLARNSDLFAAGVDLHGVHDWSTRSSSSWAGSDSPDAVKTARESSPMAAVEKWKSPVLLVHGDDDRNVDFSQTVDLAQRLRKQNVAFEQLVLPDEIHDFLLHQHWLQVSEAAAGFFDRRLKAPQ